MARLTRPTTNQKRNKANLIGILFAIGAVAAAQAQVTSNGSQNVNVKTNNGLIIQNNVTVSPEKAHAIKKESEAFGVDKSWQTTLVPGSAATVEDPKCVAPPDAMIVRLGSGEHAGTEWCTTETCKVIETPDTVLLQVSKHGKALAINAKVFGRDGKIVAEIDRDRLYVNRNDAFRWSRPDSHSIEVIDQQDEKALSVAYVNPRTIVVEGRFYDRAGSGSLEILSNDLVYNRSVHFGGACMKNQGGAGIMFGNPAPR